MHTAIYFTILKVLTMPRQCNTDLKHLRREAKDTTDHAANKYTCYSVDQTDRFAIKRTLSACTWDGLLSGSTRF